jgi:hypothetical protein
MKELTYIFVNHPSTDSFSPSCIWVHVLFPDWLDLFFLSVVGEDDVWNFGSEYFLSCTFPVLSARHWCFVAFVYVQDCPCKMIYIATLSIVVWFVNLHLMGPPTIISSEACKSYPDRSIISDNTQTIFLSVSDNICSGGGPINRSNQ